MLLVTSLYGAFDRDLFLERFIFAFLLSVIFSLRLLHLVVLQLLLVVLLLILFNYTSELSCTLLYV